MNRSLYIRLVIILLMILLIFNLNYFVKSQSDFVFLIDNSFSMNRYNQTKIKKILDNYEFDYFTFGSEFSKNGKINFTDNKSVLKYENLKKDKKYFLISDGHLKKFKEKSSYTIFPIIPARKNNFMDIQIQNAIIPKKIESNENNTVKLFLKNISNENRSAVVRAEINNDQLTNKEINIRKDEIKILEFNIKKLENKINELKIDVKTDDPITENNTLIGYIKQSKNEKDILITGKLSTELSFLKKYFEKYPSYKTDYLVKIQNDYYLNGKLSNKPFELDRYQIVISVGQSIINNREDIIFSPPGKTINQSFNMKKITGYPFFMDNVIKSDDTPSRVYMKAKDYPLIYLKDKKLIFSADKFYKQYIEKFMVYDFFIRKLISINNKIKKDLKWEFKDNILYMNYSNRILSNKKIKLYFNNKRLEGSKYKNYWAYKFNPNNSARGILKIEGKKYNLKFNQKLEKIYQDIDKSKLNKLGNNEVLRMNKYEITNKIEEENKKKKDISNNVYYYLLIIGLIFLVWIWEKY